MIGRSWDMVGQRLLVDTDVVIDDREDSKHPFFREYLRRKRGLRVTISRLEVGDFHIPARDPRDAVLVERKSANDLVSSIIDSRLWSQASRLAKAAEEMGARPILVVEGSLERVLRYRSVAPSAVPRALEVLQASYGVIVVPTLDMEHTAEWLAARARARKQGQSTSRPGESLPLAYYRRPRRMSFDERILFIAASIAGPELGRRLLERFGSLRELVNAGPRALEEVRGVGPQRAQELFMLFNKKWRPREEGGEGEGRG